MKISEIFYSVQGESSFVGLPCIFIRFVGCHLRCGYCDTEYAFHGGKSYLEEEVLDEIKRWDCQLVEITGGEPLLHKEAFTLMTKLSDMGYTVLLETSGSLSIEKVDHRVHTIMDIKCPGSQEGGSFLMDNFRWLKSSDEVKFVISDRNDYEWAREFLDQQKITSPILFSPNFEVLSLKNLAEWILQDHLPVRLQMQMHKYIWDPDVRGV